MNRNTILISLSILLGGMLVACASPASDQSTPPVAAASERPVVEPATSTPPPSPTPTAEPTSTPTNTPTSTATATPTPAPIGGGGVIAFSSVKLGSSYTDPLMDIMLLNPNSGSCTRLTTGEYTDFNSNPSWSPDGSKIIFTKAEAYSEGGLLHTINIDGSDESEVDSPFGSGMYHPFWSVNDEILVSRSAGREYPQIWLAQADNLEWEPITPEISFQFGPVWSPDGTQYAFSGSPGAIYSHWFETIFGSFRLTSYDIQPRDIWIVDVQTSRMTPITISDEDDFDPAWSPDGSKLAFVSVLEDDAEIFVVNVDRSNLTRLTMNNAHDLHPTWSPDGSMIAFTSNRDGNFEIYMMDADGQNPTRLTDNLMDDAEPNWSPPSANQTLASRYPAEMRPAENYAEFEPPTLQISDVAKTLTDAGILTSYDGGAHSLADFDQEWAQINWYSYFRTGRQPTNFVIRADASWESASDKANWFNSGCGFVFRETDVDNHYMAYLDLDGFVHLSRSKNGYDYNLGKSAVRYPLEKPADEASIMLAVDGDSINFFVDGYLMLSRQDSSLESGNLALTLLSGTNKDFGTRCTMTDIELWELKKVDRGGEASN
jgi:Tol biopolymer transport system component